jgi:hypothetical protein
MRTLILLLILFLNGFGLSAQIFTAGASKSKVEVGEPFQLNFQLSDGELSDFQPPDISNFTLLSGPSPTYQSQNLNGRISSKTTITYLLKGKNTGSFTISGASVMVGSKRMVALPVKIQVVAASPKKKPANAQDPPSGTLSQSELFQYVSDRTFIRPVLSKDSCINGETVSLTYRIFSKFPFERPGIVNAPVYNGFWVEEDANPFQVSQTEYVDGAPYYAMNVSSAILIPQRDGIFPIAPLDFQLVVKVPVRKQSNRPQSLFEKFFGEDPFLNPSYQAVQIRLQSLPDTLRVFPFPEWNKPDDFSGISGDFQWVVKMDPAEGMTGEPITLTIRIQGTGNLRMIEPPEIHLEPEFEIFEPETDLEVRGQSGVLYGTRTFTYTLIPQTPGNFQLSDLSFSFYHPDSGTYKRLVAPPLNIRVGGDPLPGYLEKLSAENERKSPAQELIGIRTASGKFRSVQGREGNLLVFLILYLLPIVLFLAFLKQRSLRLERDQDPAGLRQRQATQIARKRLAQAKTFMEAGDRKAFLDSVIKAIWGYLGDKLSIPASRLTRENVKEVLSQRAIGEGILDQLISLIDDCEAGLYAPGTPPEPGPFYDRARRLIEAIEDGLNNAG